MEPVLEEVGYYYRDLLHGVIIILELDLLVHHQRKYAVVLSGCALLCGRCRPHHSL